MKLLWLCNTAPGVVRAHISGKAVSAVNWVDHVLEGLRRRGVRVRILCPGDGSVGILDEQCSYATFREGLPYIYLPELENRFREAIETIRPDVIHIWGTEYGHTLAMVNAAEAAGMLAHTAASIQGLCTFIAGHYAEGIPWKVQRSATFRDFVRRDAICQQQKKFARRGALETKALQKLHHVIGRTDWDRACTARLNPKLCYHFCNETLREPFYEGEWRYEACRRHRVFASSCEYPVKGFHYLLEAFAEVAGAYPDATLAVTGRTFLPKDLRGRLRRTGYEAYLGKLAKQYGLEDRIEFLGSLSAAQMKAEFLNANVFAMPSTIENSPNSLGEAMLLGVPCVASYVGGAENLLENRTEGFLYQSTAAYMLACHIKKVFAMEEGSAALGHAARSHALHTHDPETNLETLMRIYEELA